MGSTIRSNSECRVKRVIRLLFVGECLPSDSAEWFHFQQLMFPVTLNRQTDWLFCISHLTTACLHLPHTVAALKAPCTAGAKVPVLNNSRCQHWTSKSINSFSWVWIKGPGERLKGDVCSYSWKHRSRVHYQTFCRKSRTWAALGREVFLRSVLTRGAAWDQAARDLGLNLIKATTISIDLILAQGLNMQRQKGELLSRWPLLSVACGRWVN